MTLAARLGTWRFYQLQGEPYCQLLREALKPAAGLTFVSNYLGASPVTAVMIGTGTMLSLVGLALLFGYIVTRYHVYRAQVQTEIRENVYASRTLDYLEKIERNTRVAA